MKKIITHILLTAILILQLSGCGEEKEPVSLNAEGTQDVVGQDSLTDIYSAAVNTPLRTENPVNALGGGGSRIFLGASRAYYFKKHLFENIDECWDEISFVTAEGNTGSESFDREHQLWDIGPAAGTDHYVVFDYETPEGETDYWYFLTERDENHEILRVFPLTFLNGSDFSETVMSISEFAVDHSGIVHMVRQLGEEQQYLLISSEGNTLMEYILEDGFSGLVPLYDGRVAYRVTRRGEETIQSSLQYMDAETGKPVELASLDKEVCCFSLLDEKTLVYADYEGVYRCGLSGNHQELLYRWSNYGILVQEVSVIQADGEGRIMLLYEDSENYCYLCLKPGAGEREVCEITFAVSSMRASVYQRLVVEFNKQHPDIRIEIRSDYDQTALLTELTAGNGPVLIDTFLTGFEEQEKLWEPLDRIVEQSGIQEELVASALELGKINGSLYGIVTDFNLRTVVTGDSELTDWDYDTFLQCIEDRPELEAVFNLYGGDYGGYFIMSFLSHGLYDTYLLDAEAGTTNFDSSGFRRALELAKKYCVREEAVNPGSSMLEGKVLCNELTIIRPEDLALYRFCYGEDANYIGYPARDGAVHFMEGRCSPMAVRRNATEREKEAAGAFISLCLSYEGQSLAAKDLNYGLSVRRDMLEEQIAAMNEYTTVSVSGFDQITLGNGLNIEKDRETLMDLIDKARPLVYFPIELRNILFEELEQYFAGAVTEDMVIDHLESRVGLYLEERK